MAPAPKEVVFLEFCGLEFKLILSYRIGVISDGRRHYVAGIGGSGCKSLKIVWYRVV